jgi:SAM-dependent methyltransferase
MSILQELFDSLPRQGPGSSECTLRAFALLYGVRPKSMALDLGCGSGFQTLDLAEKCDCRVTALDKHLPFLATVQERAEKAGLSRQVRPVAGSMFQPCFKAASFDIIWSEGALYIMGFEKGLKAWRPMLKEGGYFAATELSWTRTEIPEELSAFWKKEYPEMHDVVTNLENALRAGYVPIGHFILPASAWWDDYYTPLGKRVALLEEKYADDPKSLEVVKKTRLEIELFRKYSDWFGYVFYVMKKA